MFLIENVPPPALGTPKYDGNFNAIIEQARHEADIYRKYNVVSYLHQNYEFPCKRKKLVWFIVVYNTNRTQF